MYVIDYEGNEYPLQTTTTNEYELNGNQSLSFRILPTKVNKQFIDNITEMWQVVDHDDVTHKIIYLKKQGQGSTLSLEIKAIPKIFDDLDSQRIYKRYDRSMTANYCFNLIFEGSGYNFVLNGSFDAVQWEGFGEGDTRLECFKRALERYKAEFRIVGNTIYLENLIGRDTQFMYRYRLNASNIIQENDATAYYTYAKGYGDYGDGQGGEDWQNAKLIREYTSPIAEIIGIREAPPIKNGNITTVETMDQQLKILVDESLKISVSADIHDLRKQGYALAQPEVGDRVFLIDERIGLDTEVRVIDIELVRDWKGNVIDLKLTLGSPNLVKRHQSNLQTAVSNITNLLEGKIKLPFSVLDNAVAEATKALHNMTSELSIPPNGGLMAVDKNDPNNVVLFNAAGLGVSDDGGATFKNAITGLGINAEVITTGTMLADRIAGGILSSLNGNTEFNLNSGKLTMENTTFELGGNAEILFTDAYNKIRYEAEATRTSGVGVGLSTDGYTPISYIGTTGTSDFQVLNEYFSGVMAVTTNLIGRGGANALIGNRWHFRNKSVGYDKGYVLDMSGNTVTFVPMTTGTYDYDFGGPTSRINRIFTNGLRTLNYMEIRDTIDADKGWRIETQYPGDGSGISFRGLNTGSYNYTLGKSNARFTNVFSEWFTGAMSSSSSHNSKMNIEDLNEKEAFDYINLMKLYTFYYKESDYTNPYEKRVSPIIEQLDPANENLYKASPYTLDINSNLFLLAAAFKHYMKITDERLEVLESGK